MRGRLRAGAIRSLAVDKCHSLDPVVMRFMKLNRGRHASAYADRYRCLPAS